MQTKNQYIDQLATELKDLSAHIDQLTLKAEHATHEVQLNCQQELDDLRSQRQCAVEKLQELEQHGDDAWEVLKHTADNVWHDLRTGLATAVAKFQ